MLQSLSSPCFGVRLLLPDPIHRDPPGRCLCSGHLQMGAFAFPGNANSSCLPAEASAKAGAQPKDPPQEGPPHHRRTLASRLMRFDALYRNGAPFASRRSLPGRKLRRGAVITLITSGLLDAARDPAGEFDVAFPEHACAEPRDSTSIMGHPEVGMF